MKASLFEVLSGDTRSEPQVSTQGLTGRRVECILHNLERILNSRRGSRRHLPDFGLPDVSQIYRDIPESVEELRAAIERCIEEFEPRLTRVRVTVLQHVGPDARMRFLVSADLAKRRLRFETLFTPSDPARVSLPES